MMVQNSKSTAAEKSTSSTPTNSNAAQNGNTNNKKCKKYFLVDPTTKIYFNADFDSGNLQKVEQLSPYIYRLYPGYDRLTHSTNKTYFHFKVYGFVLCTVRFHIARVHILEKLLKTGQEACYRPVARRGKGKFEPIETGVKIYYNKSDQVELSIEYEFHEEEVWTQFAFSYPYSYEDMIGMVKELKVKYIDHPEIYFHEQVLAYSQEGRKLEIIHITEKINCSKDREEINNKDLFPDRQSHLSLPGFKVNKPKVIITGRVHPGETPASYCVEGLLRFLLDQKDYRAYLLRKNFHFIVIPMLNPDGVYHGMFRTDINGQNLNRLYINCHKQKHPTIWSVRQYLKQLQLDDEPVIFYFDFHAHPPKKQFFIYGNAFNQFTHQVEAETFGRLLENNCPYFHNVDSIFTEKQMTSKDKYDVHSKEGCARVYVHRLFNLIHSYTVECGYFAPGKLQRWQSVQAIQQRAQVLTQEYSYIGSWQQCSTKAYTPESYMLLGKSIPITILDLFHLNPYSRINLSQLRSIATIRKNAGIKIYNCVERFRMVDANVTRKIKELSKLLEEDYYRGRVGRFGLSISENYGMRHPKKTFSLLSRVYLSKKDIKIKFNNLDEQDELLLERQQNEEELEMEPEMLEKESETNLYLHNSQVNQQIQASILTHSSNFKQYKSQLQLKTHRPRQPDKKLQQKYYSEISHECLQVSKATPHSILRTIEERDNDMRETRKDLAPKESGVARVQSERSLGLGKRDSKSRKRNGTEEKVEKNQWHGSRGKTERLASKPSVEPRADSLTLIKVSRIDKFLKKQSETPPLHEVSQLERYITAKVQEEIKKAMPQPSMLSRFPSLYARHLQTQRANK